LVLASKFCLEATSRSRGWGGSGGATATVRVRVDLSDTRVEGEDTPHKRVSGIRRERGRVLRMEQLVSSAKVV
jgi:hypothetical protein